MAYCRSTVRISLRISSTDLLLLRHRAAASGVTLPLYLVSRGCERPLPAPLGCAEARREAKVPETAESSQSTSSSARVWQMWVAPADKCELQRKARASRMSLSMYLIRTGCGRPISEPLNPIFELATQQIARLGNNLAQLYSLETHGRPISLAALDAIAAALHAIDVGVPRSASSPALADLTDTLVSIGRTLNRLAVMAHRHLPVGETKLYAIAGQLDALVSNV